MLLYFKLRYLRKMTLSSETLTNYFDFLEDNLINYLLDKEHSHQMLCIYKMVCVSFHQEIMKIETKRYLKESTLLKGIREKLDEGDSMLINTDSLELFKLSLKWDDNDSTHIHDTDSRYISSYYSSSDRVLKNDDIIEIFYCDCPNCFRTEPCGRGNIKCFNDEEYDFLSLHFSWNWWDNMSYYSSYPSTTT